MNKIFKFALAALPMVMLASCAKDDLGLENEIAEKSETRYLQVTLSSPTATPVSRAGTEEEGWQEGDTNGTTSVVDGKGYYADGTEAENKISTLDFYFYTADKQYHSHVPVTVVDKDGTPGPQTPEENPRPTSPNIAAYYHCNVPIRLEQGEAIPSYVVCIVNAVAPTQYQFKSMQEAQLEQLSEIYGASSTKDVKYFGMSNSVYYGRDDVTGSSGQLIMAAPFTTDKLLTESDLNTLVEQAKTESEVQNEIEKFTINIPVERYAVKVDMDLTSLNEEGKIKDYPAIQTQTTLAEGQNATTLALKFTPKKWGVNGIEKTFYFIKSFRQPKEGQFAPDDTYATEAQLEEYMKDWSWNNPDHKRCFWARTPTYYSNNYPLTSDDLSEPQTGITYNLQYKSWADCADIPESDITNEKLGKYTEYTMETTMMQNRLNGVGLGDNYLPTASIPAVILLGQYMVGEETTYKDFYLYGQTGNTPLIYSGESTTEQIAGTSKILDRLLVDQNIVLYQKEDGSYAPINKFADVEKTIPNARGLFDVKHPEKKVREYGTAPESNDIQASILHIAEDIVTLQIKEDANLNGKLHFYNARYTETITDEVTGKKITINGRYEPITLTNLTQVNHLLFQNLGGAHFYQKGMAFFSAPIQHWGWYRSTNGNKDLTWDKWKWADMKTGDFGLVRNHIYTMQIGSISGLGTGIPDPNSPIVPPTDKVDYAVHFHVNIQRWAVLPPQNWDWN